MRAAERVRATERYPTRGAGPGKGFSWSEVVRALPRNILCGGFFFESDADQQTLVLLKPDGQPDNQCVPFKPNAMGSSMSHGKRRAVRTGGECGFQVRRRWDAGALIPSFEREHLAEQSLGLGFTFFSFSSWGYTDRGYRGCVFRFLVGSHRLPVC